MDTINYSSDDLTDHHAIGAVIKNEKIEILIIKNKEPHKHTMQVFMNIEEIRKLPALSDATQLYLQAFSEKIGDKNKE